MRGSGLVALLALGTLLQCHAQLRPDNCEPLNFFSRPDESGASGKDPGPSPVVATDIANSINSFGFNFLKVALNASASGNVVFSPLSVAAAFSLLHIGAMNDTQGEIGTTLQFVSECTPFLLQDLLNGYKEEEVAEQLSLATRLYVQEMLDVKGDFIGTVGEGNVQKTSFEDTEAAAGEINDWVSEQTNGFIDDLVSSGQLDSSTLIALVNALYFKGTWASQFDPDLTMNSTFFGGSEEAQAEFMTQTQEFRYNVDTQVLELPYVNSRFSMILVLNPEGADLSVLADNVTTALTETLDRPGFDRVEVNVTLPRFAFEDSYDLTEVLPSLGTTRVFTDDAELGGISDVPLRVATAVHKARILVNEEGTTATAATSVLVSPLIGVGSFIADRPFTFFIRDNENKLFLFMGTYTNVPT